MAPERWERIKQLVADAHEIPAADRDAWLDRASEGDAELRAEAASLLAALDENTSDPLERPAAEAFAAAPRPVDALEGQHAGPYRLLHRIGSGGMGDVYAASRDDDQFRKRVAVKLVRPGLQDPGLLDRFKTELETFPFLKNLRLNFAREDDGRSFFLLDVKVRKKIVADELVASTICGVTMPERVQQTMDWANCKIPDAVWTELAAIAFDSEDPEASRVYRPG